MRRPLVLRVRRPLVRGAGVIVAVALAVYLAALAYLFWFQRDYVFHPGGTL